MPKSEVGRSGPMRPSGDEGKAQTQAADCEHRLLRVLQASPEQKALVDEILAGRLPVPAAAALPPAPAPEPYINKTEAARRLGIKLRTLDAWMRRNLVVYYKVGRSVRFKWSEIEHHLGETCRVGRWK